MRPPVRVTTGSGFGSGVLATSGSGFGNGFSALGGVGVALSAPGVDVGGTGATVSAGRGIKRYCPSRTVRLASKLFHSANALTVTLYNREIVNAVSPRTTL